MTRDRNLLLLLIVTTLNSTMPGILFSTFYLLGPMVISWKKSDGQGGPLQYLATGTHRLTSDTRVSVEESNEQGSTLVISFANDQDVGDYVCEVSSNPPATLRHSVSLIGNHHDLLYYCI